MFGCMYSFQGSTAALAMSGTFHGGHWSMQVARGAMSWDSIPLVKRTRQGLLSSYTKIKHDQSAWFFLMFVHRRIPRISTSSEISFGIGGTCCRWAVGLVSWCSQPSLWALVWGSHWMQIQTICSWCSHTLMVLYGFGLIFALPTCMTLRKEVQKKEKNIPAGILQVWLSSKPRPGWLSFWLSAGHVICFRGWFLALLASPACRQWAMQTFHLQRTQFFPFFLEEHEDLYSKSVFLHVGSQSLRNKNPQGLLGGGFLEDVL